MNEGLQKVILSYLRQVMKPVVRLCLRNSLHVQDVIESVKIAFIDAAREELESQEQKVNVSRLAAMTGMHRRDVMRIFRDEEVKEAPQGLVSRVIGHWQQNPKFQTKSGKARVLTFEGEDAEFQDLVKSVSNDLHPGTVLFELERIGAIKKVRGGVKLIARAYVPKGNLKEGLKLLANDTEDLMSAVENNLFEEKVVPNLHAKTEYDFIDPEAVPKIREWMLREGSALHQKARNFLAKFDTETNPNYDEPVAGVRVVLGSFSNVEEELSKEDSV